MTILCRTLEHLALGDTQRVAVIDHGRIVTYADLNRRARRMAAWLHGEGLRPGDVVGLTVRDGLRHMVSTYALMRLGCVQIPLPSHEPLAMRAPLAARCRAVCVVSDVADGGIDGIGLIAPDYEAILADASLDAARMPAFGSDGATMILTSSGTTGRPKLVACTQRQVHGYGQPDIPGASVGFIHFSIESNAAKWGSLAYLARGMTIVFENAEQVSLAEICARHGVSRVNLFPGKLETLVKAGGSTTCVRPFEGVHFLTGGASVNAGLRSTVQARISAQLHVLYGATECGLAAVAGPELHAEWPNSVGYPALGVEIRIVDDAGASLPAGATGFVRIRSPWSATSYLDDEEASAKVFRDGWFQPGDVGSMTQDGQLIFSGRGDDMMILNSINIFPAEIEAVAGSFPGVRECAAFPMRSAAYGDIPLLAVVAESGLDTAALLAWCRQRLGTRAPRKVIVYSTLPRNALGKVLRRELEAAAADSTWHPT